MFYMENTECSFEEVEFMRKRRFDSLRGKFSEVSSSAAETIKHASDDDIIKLTLTINSPIKVVEAEVFNEDKFIELAF